MSELFNIPNLDVFLVGLTTIGIGIIGVVAYFSNKESVTNRTFLALSASAIIWGALNLMILKFSEPLIVIWVLRASVFFALWYAYYIFQLFYVFPKKEVVFPRWYQFILTPAVALVSLLILTPFVFEGVTAIRGNQVAEVANGPGIIVFGVLAFGLNIGGLILLLRKTFRIEKSQRLPYFYIFFGAVITYSLILIFNFIFPAFFNQTEYLSLAALFTLPFIGFTGYAIIKHKLIDLKIIATQAVTAVLALVSLLEVIFTKDVPELIFRVSVFVLILIFGSTLIRGVMREVAQREEIEHLAENLRRANEKLKELDKLKSQFLSIASHDLRAPLTVIRNYVSLVLDGSYGKMPKAAEEGLHQVFERATDMAQSVDTYLNVSRIEQGKMKYEFIDVDLAPLIVKAVKDFTPNAEKKGVRMTFTLNPELENKKARLDIAKINEVLNNLLDNSIKYTPKGTISVVAERLAAVARITITDTGIGMSQETISKLFQLFSAGENSLKINISSTGVGLYITKAHVLAHKGRVWAESDGEGKGSRFILELPLLN
ncbi:HAMP domain-containing histidine kinase [Patescibacteria group bacterium]|nr:HAMP domain-containing histidine kinase [Patescibacteria group bacterium]